MRFLTLSRLVMILTLAAVFAMAFRAPLDSDTYWHLRAGEWQVENRAVLRVDLFSHTQNGNPWLNHSWLSQIILYGFHQALGETGLAIFTALAAAVGMGFVYRASEGDAILRAFVVVLAAAAAAIFWSARPQMMSFSLSAVVVYLLRKFQKRGVDRLWIIPVLILPWANLHLGYSIAMILLILAALGEGAVWLLGGVLSPAVSDGYVRPTLKPVIRLAVVALVSAGVAIVNPFGLDLLLLPFRTVGIGVLRDFIQEWAAPDFHLPQTWPFLWLLLGTLAMAGLSPKRLDLRDAVLVTGTAYLAMLAGRNIATFALVAAPVLSEHLAAWLDARGFHLKSDRPARGARLALNWALLVLALVGAAAKGVYALDSDRLETARQQMFPVAALEAMRSAQVQGPVFNSYNWGGYMTWAAREWPVYVDGRTDLYGDALLREYLNIYFAQPGWEDALDESDINLVLVESSSPLAQVLALSDGWASVHVDEVAVVFRRDTVVEE